MNPRIISSIASGTTYLPINRLCSSRMAGIPMASLADGAESDSAEQMVPQQESKQRHRQKKERASGSDRRPVGQARSELRRDERRRGLRVTVRHHQREGVLIPGGDETEHGGRRNSRRRFWEHDLEESPQAGVAVDQGRLLVFLGDLVDEAFHQPNRKRQVEGGIENDQTNVG